MSLGSTRRSFFEQRGVATLDYLLIVSLVILPLFTAVKILASALQFAYWLGALVIDSPFM